MILCPICGTIPAKTEMTFRLLCRCERLSVSPDPDEFIFRAALHGRYDIIQLFLGELRRAPNGLTYDQLEDVPMVPAGEQESSVASVIRDALVGEVLSS